MIDDGSDAGDNEGANNFLRFFAKRSTDTSLLNIVRESRVGGGAVSSATLITGLPMIDLYGFQMTYGIGTRWTSWSTFISLIGETGASFLGSVGGSAWTPARHGLYYFNSLTSRDSAWDWFDES